MNLSERYDAIEDIETFVSSFLDDGVSEYYFPNDPKLDEPGIRRIIKLTSDEQGDLNIIFQKRLYAEKPNSKFIPVSENLLKIVDSITIKDQIEQAKVLSQLILSVLLSLDHGGIIYQGYLGDQQLLIKNNNANKKAANQILSMFESMVSLDAESERLLIKLLANSDQNIEELISFFASRVKLSVVDNSEELERFFISDKITKVLTNFVHHCDNLIKNNNEQGDFAPKA